MTELPRLRAALSRSLSLALGPEISETTESARCTAPVFTLPVGGFVGSSLLFGGVRSRLLVLDLAAVSSSAGVIALNGGACGDVGVTSSENEGAEDGTSGKPSSLTSSRLCEGGG
jgi:hypothetical protein